MQSLTCLPRIPWTRLAITLLQLCVAVDLNASTPGKPDNPDNPDTAENGCRDRAQRVAAQLDAMRLEMKVPAMGLSIFCDAQPILIEGYGSANGDTPFRWGSITKSVTGLAALALIRTTDATLSTPIRPIIGAGYYHNPWAATQPLRFGHLLALSAGLPDLSRAEWNDNDPLPLWQALARHQAERTLLWPPGLQHSYSNVPPGFTAAVIERLSGNRFETYLAEHLFEPLGMHAASLSPVPGLPGGFQADGQTEIPYWHMTFPAFGALNASTREMSRLLTALLNLGQLDGKRVLAPELVSTFFAPLGTLGATAGLEVGYGAGVYGWIRDGHLFHGHGGDADGYRSRYGLLRAEGRGYLLVINADNARLLGAMRRLLEAALIADLPPSTSPLRSASANASTSTELDALTGEYYPASARFNRAAWQSGNLETAHVRRAGDTLVFERAGRVTRLHSAGQGRFFRENDPAISVVFAADGEKQVYLQGLLGEFVRTSPGPCPDFLPFCD